MNCRRIWKETTHRKATKVVKKSREAYNNRRVPRECIPRKGCQPATLVPCSLQIVNKAFVRKLFMLFKSKLINAIFPLVHRN